MLAPSVGASFLSYRVGPARHRRVRTTTAAGCPTTRSSCPTSIGAAMVLDLPDKQALLAAPTTSERLRLELALLRREDSVLRRLPSLPGVEYTRQPYSSN